MFGNNFTAIRNIVGYGGELSAPYSYRYNRGIRGESLGQVEFGFWELVAQAIPGALQSAGEAVGAYYGYKQVKEQKKIYEKQAQLQKELAKMQLERTRELADTLMGMAPVVVIAGGGMMLLLMIVLKRRKR